MRVTFETEQWQFANNGATPKGFGNWAFSMVFGDSNGRYFTERFQFRGTFSEAKAAVRAEAKQVKSGCSAVREVTVEVMP